MTHYSCDLLAYDFMQRLRRGRRLASPIIGRLSSRVVMAFVGAGPARHLPAWPSAVGWPPGWGHSFGLATVWLTGGSKREPMVDVSIGILYTTTMALGILFI